MSEDYTVNLGALGDLITKLHSAAKSITAANNALKGTSKPTHGDSGATMSKISQALSDSST